MAGYCLIADVQSRTGFTYSGTTKPTDTVVTAFIDNRASHIYGWLAEVMGVDAPGPSGSTTTIDTGNDSGAQLAELCEQANAVAAAADALGAGGFQESPARTERITELLDEFEGMKDEIQSIARAYQQVLSGQTAVAATHLDEGRVTEDSITSSRTQQGLTFDDTTQF